KYEEWAATGRQMHNLSDGGVNYTETPPHIKETVARLKMFEAGYAPDNAVRNAWSGLAAMAKREGAEGILSDLTLLLEPGRSVVADAGICLTTVRNHKERPLSDIRRTMAATANRQQME